MARPQSTAFTRIRAEVVRLVGTIPKGKFSTYGAIGVHMNVQPRHVAFIMARLTPEESRRLPWHRVVGAEARISPNMDASLARTQRRRLTAEGLKIDAKGFIQNDEAHFHPMGPRRAVRWDQAA